MITESLKAFGLTREQVVLTVILFVLLLAILFAFMILTLSSWTGETAFSALAQSGLVCAVAKSITTVRKRSKAEEGGAELEKAIDFIVGEQSAAAEEQ